jgi:hypothetical protein
MGKVAVPGPSATAEILRATAREIVRHGPASGVSRGCREPVKLDTGTIKVTTLQDRDAGRRDAEVSGRERHWVVRDA